MIRAIYQAEWVRWGLKSGAALAINVALLTVWVEIGGIEPEWAALLNAAIIPPAMYAVVDRWVFSNRESPESLRGHIRQFVGMYTANSVAKIGNYGIYLTLIWASVPYQAAWVIGAVIMFLVSFGLNRRWWAALADSQPA